MQSDVDAQKLSLMVGLADVYIMAILSYALLPSYHRNLEMRREWNSSSLNKKRPCYILPTKHSSDVSKKATESPKGHCLFLLFHCRGISKALLWHGTFRWQWYRGLYSLIFHCRSFCFIMSMLSGWIDRMPPMDINLQHFPMSWNNTQVQYNILFYNHIFCHQNNFSLFLDSIITICLTWRI